MRRLSRRFLLAGGAAGLTAGADAAPPLGTVTRAAPRSSAAGLHSRALHKGLFYGAAVDLAALRDTALMTHVATECGMIAPENSFTWSQLRPRPDHFAFDRAEMMAGYAARHNFRLRGRALVWHRNNPDWLDQVITGENAEKLLTSHIHEVAGHFRRRVAQWDVVNEPVAPDDGNLLGLRSTRWLRALGPRYLDLAFHACAAADPSALRVLNEQRLDYAVPEQERRRNAILELLADLTSRGVPVQALGLQAHLFAAEFRLNQTVLAKFCDDVAALGLRIVVTEMDIRDNELPAAVAARDHAVAAHGRAYLDAVLSSQAVIGVVTWGLSDRRTWLNDQMPRLDRLPQRPLPLDAEMRRKPLWGSMAVAFDTVPARQDWRVPAGL